MTRWALTKHFYEFKLVRRQKKTKQNMHSPFYITLFALVQIIHGEINQDAATQVTWEYSHHSLARCFLEHIFWTALWWGNIPTKLLKENKKRRKSHQATCFAAGLIQKWAVPPAVGSDWGQITFEPLQGLFVPRLCLQGGLGTLVWCSLLVHVWMWQLHSGVQPKGENNL